MSEEMDHQLSDVQSSMSTESVELDDESRAAVLGFKPQRENPYNHLLPYADRLDVESNEQLAEIKANLARVVQMRDIKIGGTHWTGQLAKYIRLYGLKFSKIDHVLFVRLVYEMLTIPELDYSMVLKFAQLLTSLLKKHELISRNDLTLEWRPLYRLLRGAVYSSYESYGLVLLPSNIEPVLKTCVQACRVYFPVDSTQEMLDEWRPLLCPFDTSMTEAVYFMECFLPTKLYPHEYDKGFRLWLDELLGLWQSCQGVTGWDNQLMRLFSRLSDDCLGSVVWAPHVPKLFTSILRSFGLPVGSTQVTVMTSSGSGGGGGGNNNAHDPTPACVWIASALGSDGVVQEHLNKLFKALESFYHPSNYGRWNAKLMKFLAKLPECVVKRIQREKYWNTWLPVIGEKDRLSSQQVTQFVESIKDVLYLALFNKTGSYEAAAAFQYTACMRPEIIIPPLLDRTYPALQTLTEPHRLSACLQCVVAVSRCMLSNPHWYPEGRSHVIPLLTFSLPGIDPNDIKKSLMTFHLISSFSSLVPIVDCSSATPHVKDITEEEIELCSATAQFEDVVLQFFYRVFALVENSVHQQTRTDSTAAVIHHLNSEEEILEVCLLGATYSMLRNCSLNIYQEALSRLYNFSTESVFEVKVAGRFTSNLVQSAARAHPELAVPKFVPGLCKLLIDRTQTEDLSKDEQVENDFLWNLKLLSEVVRCDGTYLVPYAHDIMSVLRATLHMKCKDVLLLSGNLLRNVLKQLTMVYTLNSSTVYTDDWQQNLSDNRQIPIRNWGSSSDLKQLKMKWHIPSKEEKRVAEQILQDFLFPELTSIDQHVSGTATLEREDLLQSLSIINHCLIGAGGALPHWTGPAVHLVDSLVELTRFSHIANCESSESGGITLNGRNVRELIISCIRPLLAHMLSASEDDTKSLLQIIKVINCLMYFHGTGKDEFEGRWKNRHFVKRFMENKLLGKKKHIEPILIDRVHLQHELRTINQSSKTFSDLHLQLFSDLFKLSVSRYMQVRKSAQSALGHGFHVFAYSYRRMLDDVTKFLKNEDQDVEHHQLKGALYLVLGQSKRTLVARRSWDVSAKLWPALVRVQQCERPSVIQLR